MAMARVTIARTSTANALDQLREDATEVEDTVAMTGEDDTREETEVAGATIIAETTEVLTDRETKVAITVFPMEGAVEDAEATLLTSLTMPLVSTETSLEAERTLTTPETMDSTV